MDDAPFSLIDAQAIHEAFTDAMASAKERETTMPSSAAALRARADNLLRVRNKLLATLDPRFRANYPPFD